MDNSTSSSSSSHNHFDSTTTEYNKAHFYSDGESSSSHLNGRIISDQETDTALQLLGLSRQQPILLQQQQQQQHPQAPLSTTNTTTTPLSPPRKNLLYLKMSKVDMLEQNRPRSEKTFRRRATSQFRHSSGRKSLDDENTSEHSNHENNECTATSSFSSSFSSSSSSCSSSSSSSASPSSNHIHTSPSSFGNAENDTRSTASRSASPFVTQEKSKPDWSSIALSISEKMKVNDQVGIHALISQALYSTIDENEMSVAENAEISMYTQQLTKKRRPPTMFHYPQESHIFIAHHHHYSRLNRRKSDPALALSQRDAISTYASSKPIVTINENNQKSKTYSCLFPNCNKQFSRLYNLKSHSRTHTNERPYPCELCVLAFSRNHDLKRHMKIHEGDKPYRCLGCEKAFTRLDALKRHKTNLRSRSPCVNSPLTYPS